MRDGQTNEQMGRARAQPRGAAGWAHLHGSPSQLLVQLSSQDGRGSDLILGGLCTLPGREVNLSTSACTEAGAAPSPWA